MQQFDERLSIAEDMEELFRVRFESRKEASLQFEDFTVFQVGNEQRDDEQAAA
jgi:hypothetical protein